MSKAAVGFPLSVQDLSPRVQGIHQKVRRFVTEDAIPLEQEWVKHHENPATKWTLLPHIVKLQAKAKAEGLWNLFLPLESDPGARYGPGLTNVEYAFLAEEMGRCLFAPEIFNCNAPNSGNIEVLVRYGTEAQKERWLPKLMDGTEQSCFGMTEPAVASSDATNIQASIKRDGDYYIINGRKWWTSGACDPRCTVCIFMGKTDLTAPVHKQQTMVIVPMDAPGVKMERHLSLFGYDEPPHGHAEVSFTNVRVPVSNVMLGEGRGFEIAQGRLGPARIHHSMRLIGSCERALELMINRVKTRVAWGKPLVQQGTIQADIAQCRIDIEQARLLVLKAAHMMDTVGNKVAAGEIAMIKVAVANLSLGVLDKCLQAFGGMGFCTDTPIPVFYAYARRQRVIDGPDEVHRRALARMELKKYGIAKL